jgi:hypothetical protein
MIGIVSTFSDNGYQEYAHQFVNSLNKFLSKKIEVFLYIDNIAIDVPENTKLIKLEPSVPELTNFKNRNKHKPVTDFMADGVRFSHKSYAIWHAATTIDINKFENYKLFWLDADTVMQQNVDEHYFSRLLPDGLFTSFLGRPGRYTETGFIGFDLKHPAKNDFFAEFIDYYNSDKIYSELPAYTDCHVYDATKEKFIKNQKIKALDLTPGLSKGNFNHIHKGYMVHNKGANKLGKTGKKLK